MRRWLELGTMTAAVAAMLSCGPPPVPLQATVTYADSCPPDPTHPSCVPAAGYFAGLPGSGTPPLIVRCIVQAEAPGHPAAIQFTVGRAMDGTSTPTDGLSICGNASAANTDVANPTVTLYANGTSTGHSAECQVRLDTLTTTDFSGRVHCTGLPDGLGNPHLRTLAGTTARPGNPNGDPATVSADWAEFSVKSCDTTTFVTGC